MASPQHNSLTGKREDLALTDEEMFVLGNKVYQINLFQQDMIQGRVCAYHCPFQR